MNCDLNGLNVLSGDIDLLCVSWNSSLQSLKELKVHIQETKEKKKPFRYIKTNGLAIDCLKPKAFIIT